MTEIKNRHKRFIAEFIELYKSHPTLWDLKSSEYNDRDCKRNAYVKMVQKLQEIEPDCTKYDVIKKINSLRSAFRREYRKKRRMKICGKSYKSSLWYYNLISFTVTGAKGTVYAGPITNPTVNIPIATVLVEGECIGGDNDNFYVGIQHRTDEDIADLDVKTSADPLTMVAVKQEEDRSFVDENNLRNPITSNFKREQDEFSAVGYNVASKLTTMDRMQRIIAERIIAETLFQGQMGTLDINSSVSHFLPTTHSEYNVKSEVLDQ